MPGRDNRSSIRKIRKHVRDERNKYPEVAVPEEEDGRRGRKYGHECHAYGEIQLRTLVADVIDVTLGRDKQDMRHDLQCTQPVLAASLSLGSAQHISKASRHYVVESTRKGFSDSMSLVILGAECDPTDCLFAVGSAQLLESVKSIILYAFEPFA
jgi:hypothetical protein